MGVRYHQKDGRDEVARCSREIILAGGAVNSPQLLMCRASARPTI